MLTAVRLTVLRVFLRPTVGVPREALLTPWLTGLLKRAPQAHVVVAVSSVSATLLVTLVRLALAGSRLYTVAVFVFKVMVALRPPMLQLAVLIAAAVVLVPVMDAVAQVVKLFCEPRAAEAPPHEPEEKVPPQATSYQPEQATLAPAFAA